MRAGLVWRDGLPQADVDRVKGKDGKSVAYSEMKGLPGHYWIGGLFSPWSGFTEFGTNDKRSGSYGFYVHGDQMLYQEQPGSDHGLTIWAASGPEVGHRMRLTKFAFIQPDPPMGHPAGRHGAHSRCARHRSRDGDYLLVPARARDGW